MKSLFILPLGAMLTTLSVVAQNYPNLATVLSDGNPAVQGSDFVIYTQTSGSTIELNSGGSAVTEMQGAPGFTGGNVELSFTSDFPENQDPSVGGSFATMPHVTLNLGFDSNPGVVFSSLNGADWFTTSGGAYVVAPGADNLANRWWNDFLGATGVGDIIDSSGVPGARDGAFMQWANSGGFARLSDPNIAYAYYQTDGTFTYGLGSFLDDSPRIREFLNSVDPSGFYAGQVPDGIQLSEVVLVNGSASYAFQNAVPSGVRLDDGVDSYIGVNPFPANPTVPEPSSSLLLVLGALVPSFSRRRSKK